ncbi:DUF3592 domain-containing protein [Falsiroseomonas stagni]|uniref:Uncharacterized protein n=1 Tax=Falsiroseomonas stagni DSM 19981 TaxID=1123062 RepID=A0A1I3Z485_9PROT|nr:DUF3592 domain-containing protein [Falsiroseomonas stagni]SFK38865.1 hypothetical protein SAMN02745775_102138 [Falsiroseomonas stagni DSM 19981]
MTAADPPPPTPLPSYTYLLVGWRQFWPTLLEETRRHPERRLRRSGTWVLLSVVTLCIVAAAQLSAVIPDIRARQAWKPLPATIVAAQPGGGGRQGGCFHLRLDVEARGRVIPTVTTTHPHCPRRSWSDPPRPPQPGDRITVRADPNDLRRLMPDSALLRVFNYIAMVILLTILGIIPTALALVEHRAARIILREREGRA